MDVEIVKKNGRKFRLSDYGVVKDFVVSSIDREVVRDSVDGRPGSLDYGVIEGDRTISVPFILKAEDLHDYAHLRDELYSILGDSEPFFIRELRRPRTLQYDFVGFGESPKWSSQTENEYVNGKQYQVRLYNSLTPEQRSLSGEVNIEFVTSGLPYAESIYTTLELHDSGYSASAEKYGLVDNIVDEKVKYRFEGAPYNENLMNAPYDYRNPTGSNYETIHPGLPAGKYTISFDYEIHEVGRSFNGFLLYAGKTIGNIPRTSKNADYTKMTFDITSETADTPLYLYAGTAAGYSRENDGSFKNVKIESGNQATSFNIPTTNFTVYNAGNVTVEAESMDINIIIAGCKGNKVTIHNKTTGDKLEINVLTSGHIVTQRGMVVSVGGVNRFRDTNRRFISLAPGDNVFEISGATFERASIDFKNYYK